MEIRFGAPLLTRDGAQVGSIQRVVLESDTQRLRALTVRIGHVFARERIVGLGYLQPTEDGRRVIADCDVASISLLPLLSETAITDNSGDRDRVQPYTAWTGGEMPVTSYVTGSAAVNRRMLPSYDTPAPDRDVTLVDSNTTVQGHDGRKIGSVSAVVCDEAFTAIGLMIKRPGLLHHREIYVPTDLAHYSSLTASVLGLEWTE
jgi:uncharacterized protein YrrD